MDATALTPDGSRELAELRQRAYGPDADIQRDPEAMRRLHDLEALSRPSAASAQAAPVTAEREGLPVERSAAGPAFDAAAAAEAEPSLEASTPGPAAPAATRQRWWRVRPVWIAAVVCLVLGLVGGSAGVWFSTPHVTDRPDETLVVVGNSTDVTVAWIADLSSWGVKPSSVTKFQPFDTVDVWVGQTSLDSTCILLSHMGRVFTTSCAARGLDPVLDLTVDPSLPVHWTRAMPFGTVVRFIATSHGVDVWVRHPPFSGTTTSN
jgi:hypothetical protein